MGAWPYLMDRFSRDGQVFCVFVVLFCRVLASVPGYTGWSEPPGPALLEEPILDLRFLILPIFPTPFVLLFVLRQEKTSRRKGNKMNLRVETLDVDGNDS